MDENPPNNPVAKRLKNFFSGKNISRIAEEIGLSRHQITNQCNGKSPPSAKILTYVTENGGDIVWILTGKKQGKLLESIQDGFLAEIVSVWPKLSKAERADLAKTAVEKAENKTVSTEGKTA